METYIYIGLFKNTELIFKIVKDIKLPNTKPEQQFLINSISKFIEYIEVYYKPIDNEYIAYDFIKK